MALPPLPHGPVQIDTGTVELVRVPGDPTGVTVLVNGAESSHLDLSDPARLEFEYMQQMVVLLDSVFPEPDPIRALHLGGAGCALPRALDARRPGSRQVVVEIDRALARAVRAWFDLPRAPRLRLRTLDAREAVDTCRPASFDVVVRDAFDGRSVPEHLRTREFAESVARVLGPGGLYLVNCIDAPPLRLSRIEAATLRTVFRTTVVITERAVLRGRRYGNVVLAAGDRALPETAIRRALNSLPLPVTMLSGAEVADFVGSERPRHDPPAAAPADGSPPRDGAR